MASLSSEDNSYEGLCAVFTEALKCQETIENSDLASSSREYQTHVRTGIELLIKATEIVNIFSIFSRNEELEEIPTADLRYLLLPALLGSLTCQLNSEDRKQDLERAVIYYNDFTRRIDEYGITSTVDNRSGEAGPGSKVGKELADAAATRANKIARLKAKKSLEQKLKELDKHKHIDDATLREHTVTMIRLWITRCVDEFEATKQELELLEKMEGFKNGPAHPSPPQPHSAPLKPILITRDMIQQKVFGAGYPSLPTMSVEEWYDNRVREGVIPLEQTHREERDMSKWVGKGPNRETDDNGEEGDRSDEDEDAKRKKDIQFDEFKDDNKKGSGNRKNRS